MLDFLVDILLHFLGDITILQTLLLRSCVSITFPVAGIRCHRKSSKENGIDFGSQLKGTVQPKKEGLAAGA